MNTTTHYIGPRRRLFQWATTLLVLLVPWVDIGGNSLLRIDIPSLTIYLFGQVLRIQELFLVLLAGLILALGFLLVTVVLGRVWCGWLCPQTTLSDLAEWMARRLGLTVRNYRIRGGTGRHLLLHLFFLFLAFLTASNLLWYFIPPRDYFTGLFSLDLHYAAWITLGVVGGLVYLNLALVRRVMCRDFCPYGRIQTALVDRATLSLHLPDTEMARCIQCESCVRACPMEIDIRNGYQVECTNCGRCLDACRRVMAGRGEPGLIRYTFGLHGEGAVALLNPRVLLPAAAVLLLLAVLFVSLAGRPQAGLKIAVSHTAAPRLLKDGRIGIFYNAWVNNRAPEAKEYRIKARRLDTGAPLTLKGQVRAELPPGTNRRLDVVLVTPRDATMEVKFVLVNREGVEVSSVETYIDTRGKE